MSPYKELRNRLTDSTCPWTLTKPGNHEQWELPGGFVFLLSRGITFNGHGRQNYLKQIERAENAYLDSLRVAVKTPAPSPSQNFEPRPLPLVVEEPAPMPVVTPSVIAGQSVNAVNARDLHGFLGVGRVFRAWISDRIEAFGFQEHKDYEIQEVLSRPDSDASKARPQMAKEYFLTLDMAKELCMVERNEKGKQARAYFIDCEKKLVLTYQAPKNPFLDMSEEEWLEYTLLQLREKKEKEAVITRQQQTIGCQAEEIQALNEIAEETSGQLERIATAPMGSLSLWEAAKHLQVSPRWFGDWLREIGWLYPGPFRPIARQGIINSGWLKPTVREYGRGPSYEMVTVTPAGLVKLSEILVKEKLA